MSNEEKPKLSPEEMGIEKEANTDGVSDEEMDDKIKGYLFPLRHGLRGQMRVSRLN